MKNRIFVKNNARIASQESIRAFLIYTNMKLDKLIYDVREAVSQYQDDSLITDDYIIYLLNSFRSKILRNQLNNYQMIINPLTLQTFCLELEEVSALECGVEFGCDTIIRTVRPLPIPIKSHLGVAITSVRTVNRLAIPMSMIEPESAPYYINSKFGNSVYYYVGSDMRLYFVSKNRMLYLLDCISVTGIFADPLELEDYSKCCNCDADDDDNKCFDLYQSEYPIDPDLSEDLTKYVIQKLINKLEIHQDTNNNATND